MPYCVRTSVQIEIKGFRGRVLTNLKLYFIIYEVWIQRHITEALRRAAKQRPCVLLTGARQAGKSSLLQRVFPKHHYISLDLPTLAHEAKINGLAFLSEQPRPMIIDEVQYAPELFRYLKIKIDQNRNLMGQYILTGSQKFSLMHGVSDSLSGRIAVLECHPLSLHELYEFQSAKINAPDLNEEKCYTQYVSNYIVQGGYPEIHSQSLSGADFYKDYLVTYLERDVRQIINIKYLHQFEKFLRLLALNVGQVLSLNRIGRGLGISAHTVSHWLSALEASNIVYLLQPFYNNYGKRLLKSPKLYFLDTGFCSFLNNIYTMEDLISSSLKGALFENLVALEFLKYFYNNNQVAQLYYFSNQEYEVDFVIPYKNKVRAFEVKWKHQALRSTASIQKFIATAGHNLHDVHIITNSPLQSKINKNTFITPVFQIPRILKPS